MYFPLMDMSIVFNGHSDGVKCSVAAVKRLLLFHHSVDYMILGTAVPRFVSQSFVTTYSTHKCQPDNMFPLQNKTSLKLHKLVP